MQGKPEGKGAARLKRLQPPSLRLPGQVRGWALAGLQRAREVPGRNSAGFSKPSPEAASAAAQQSEVTAEGDGG